MVEKYKQLASKSNQLEKLIQQIEFLTKMDAILVQNITSGVGGNIIPEIYKEAPGEGCKSPS